MTELTHLAIINGHKTTARKYGRKWMVGGDFPAGKNNISIVAWHKDKENGGGFWAWYALKGCFLIFQDHCDDNEIEEHTQLFARS